MKAQVEQCQQEDIIEIEHLHPELLTANNRPVTSSEAKVKNTQRHLESTHCYQKVISQRL